MSRAQLFYLIFISSVTVRFKDRVRVLGLVVGLVVELGLGLINPTCANLVLRVIWQCDIFGMTPGFVTIPAVSNVCSEVDRHLWK